VLIRPGGRGSSRGGQPGCDAGIILGLETSLSPADHLKLVNWVGNRSIQVYYDVRTMAEYGHTWDAVPDISPLGKSHIC